MHDFEEECLTLFYAMVCSMLSQQKQLITLTWTLIIMDIAKNHPIILLYKMTINNFFPSSIYHLITSTLHNTCTVDEKRGYKNNLQKSHLPLTRQTTFKISVTYIIKRQF